MKGKIKSTSHPPPVGKTKFSLAGGAEKGARGKLRPARHVRQRRTGGGKRRRILRQQKGKAENFSSLKEKLKKEGTRQKMNGKIFCFAHCKANATAGRAGFNFNLYNITSSIQNRQKGDFLLE